MPFVKVAAAAGIEADSVTEVLVGDTPYAICNVGGKITALNGTCPHNGGPLGQGAINGPNVVCPWHAWEFDALTGACIHMDGTALRRYAVELRGGEIWVEID